jgi:hypothetical protein
MADAYTDNPDHTRIFPILTPEQIKQKQLENTEPPAVTPTPPEKIATQPQTTDITQPNMPTVTLPQQTEEKKQLTILERLFGKK